ncbi:MULTISPECIES: alpha/beta fold hydrolase [Arthrospira]|jgi:pimeloyl-ACP methyl ester carboxylesterase|uniref:Haloalkane dehalogenase n=1 Tax=Limnospira platensis NIES-46 TaxID=1236695 RepID=A0A5M3T1R3_LIMPL|nr:MULTISPECIES: alpha/beta hydrolase [Arthrospira]AMW31867.1 haloalkane dehalogenase [Arthrospira platensis YZ]KDR54956.1 haloalkane dehalogenase [Arthrospira platensis str. Paraca]MBD2669626.1 alpha/beta hydrolase [Arthrospira platensis FACHB-439]MBD2709827.1 alpha/beta hydrolase [Arthrospira platensis FACHB-835]MDF2208635.1 alpha/beta hydrolase [Arthrospira platensis NCB002]MDT9182373.1 alpha/beta hydrolase [Limnospira sp. PMC 289.06]MDT9294564.1 alpha/beta hydrolase [Arthrospira platensi
MSPTRQTLELKTLKLSYLEWNPNGQQPLLLLHGLADHALVWTSLAEYLGDRYHIIAPDMRGHGDSDKPDHGYTFDEAIADLEELMDHHHWSNAHILGHSWTGKLLPIWAKKHPERFRCMILVDPIFITKMPGFLKLTLPIVYRKLDSLKCLGPFESFTAAENQAKQLRQFSGWSPQQQQVFAAAMEAKPDGKWGSKFSITARNEIFLEVMKIPGLTEAIAIPTLLVQPEKGVNRMEWQLKPYQKYLTNLTIQQVPGNHWPFLVASESFNQTISEFLNQHN